MSRHSHTALSFYLKCSLSLSLPLSLSLSLKLAVYKENTISPNKDFPHSKGNQLQSLNSRVLLHFTSRTYIYIYICLGFQYSVFGFRAPIDSVIFLKKKLYISVYSHYCGYLGFNGGLVENENV